MVTTPNFDLDTDTTLGGNNASDYVIPSQKAIKSYVDNNSGGGGTVDQTFDPTSANAQSGVAIAGAKFLQNEATQSGSSIILQGTTKNSLYAIGIGLNNSVAENGVGIGLAATTTNSNSTSIGANSRARGKQATALGSGAMADANSTLAVGSSAGASVSNAIAVGLSSLASSSYATALGSGATAGGNYAIQIGYGTNNTANTLNVGFWNATNTHYNWQLLDGTTGLIPDARISSNIARTSDLSGFVQASNGNMTFANAGTEGDILYTDSTTGDFYGVVIGQSSTYGTGVTIGAGNAVAQNGYMLNLTFNGFAVVDASNMGTALLTVSNNNLAVNGSEVVTGSNTRFDGQWVYTKSTLANGVAMANSDASYSLSTYLPNDNYKYEVLFAVNATSGTSTGNRIYITLQSDISTAVETAYAIPRSNNSVTAYGTCILAVGSGRSVTVAANSTPKGNYYLYACGYRRIGTNT